MASIYEQAVAIREQMTVVNSQLDDSQAKEVPLLFELWQPGVEYQTGTRIRYEEVLYKVLQDHQSQADWPPNAAVSLYVKISDPTEEWPAWVQPLGAHDAYPKGAKVSHKGKRWVSAVDANTWEPGVYGWEEAEV
jgi:hypothetical protein